MMNKGDKVKQSEYAIRPHRDYWLSCGRHSDKSNAAQWLKDEVDKRGIILEIGKNGQGAEVARVQWNDGAISECLAYRIMPA